MPRCNPDDSIAGHRRLAHGAYAARCAAARPILIFYCFSTVKYMCHDEELQPPLLPAQAMFASLRERLCLESVHGLRPARVEEASARMETSVMMLGALALLGTRATSCVSAVRRPLR